MSALDGWLAALNGLVGDHLDRSRNGLATEMAFYEGGAAVAEPRPGARRVAVLVHGLMNDESVWTMPDGSDYGTRLAADLGMGALYVRYNSGRSIPDNGASLADLLAGLCARHGGALDELVPIGHSLGGLVIRSASHVAHRRGDAWLALVHRAIYLGTPHRGAPLERAGRVVGHLLAGIDDPYTRLVAELGDLRSDAIKDLGDADLRHEDRARRLPRFSLRDPRHPVPLLPGIRHALVAGTLSKDPIVTALLGDAIVPVSSATDGRLGDVVILPGLAHLTLARHPEVYRHVRRFCEEA